MPPDVDITLIVIIAIVLGGPVLGLTARLAIKPLVEALILIQESLGKAPSSDLVDLRLTSLEGELVRLSESVDRLLDAKGPVKTIERSGDEG
jgi:hypothetical protein